MKSPFTVMFGSVVISALLSGCNENSKSSSMVTTNFSMSGTMESSGAVARSNFQKAIDMVAPSAVASMPPEIEDANQANVQLNEAWIVVKKIQFKPSQIAENAEENDQNLNYKGPYYVDLLSEEASPFGAIEVPSTGLRRVKMLLHKANELPDSAPVALDKKSIYISGIVDGKNFSYAADDTDVFEISGPAAVVPEEGKDLMAVIRLPELIAKIDLSSVTEGMKITSSQRGPALRPCPQIHPTASDLYTCFKKGLASEAKFGKDQDGNRVLDSGEDNS